MITILHWVISMPGHIEKRSEKSWTIVIEYGKDPSTGKRKRFKKAFRGSKKDAEREMARLLTEVEQGLFIEPSKMTVAEFFQKWLTDYAKANVAPRTYHRYEEIVLKSIIPNLGQLPITKLKPLHVQNYYTKMLTEGRAGRTGGLSPTTVLQHHRIIHKALEMAVKWLIVPRNIADAVEPPKKVKKEMKVLTVEQVTYMLQEAAKTQFFPQIVLAIYTGMRRGEIYGLRWQDINFENGTITINQAAQYIPKQGLSSKLPKNEKSRVVDVPDIVIKILKQVKAKQNEDRLAAGENWKDKEGLVFTDKNGGRLHPDSISSWFPDWLEEIKLPRIRFHDLRHTYASLVLNDGADLKVVSANLGHASVGFTGDIYAHLMPGKQKQIAQRLQEKITPKNFGHQMGTKTSKQAPE